MMKLVSEFFFLVIDNLTALVAQIDIRQISCDYCVSHLRLRSKDSMTTNYDVFESTGVREGEDSEQGARSYKPHSYSSIAWKTLLHLTTSRRILAVSRALTLV